MNLIDNDLREYAEQWTTSEPELIEELVKVSNRELKYTEMLSGRVVGTFLKMMVSVSNAKSVLEIGTFSGYSALMMADALPGNGQLVTCEVNEKYQKIAESFFERSSHGDKINLMMGPALESLDKLRGGFDLVFLDADKVNYPNYYEKIIPMLPIGGVIIVDNVFWSGEVLNPEDEKSRAIDRLNKFIHRDERVEQVILTVRDGLNMVRKVSDG